MEDVTNAHNIAYNAIHKSVKGVIMVYSSKDFNVSKDVQMDSQMLMVFAKSAMKVV